jgi:hypothetical protein
MADLGVRPVDAAWRHRVYDIFSPRLGVMMLTCGLAGVGAVFAPVVGLIWLTVVVGLIAYVGIRAALERP